MDFELYRKHQDNFHKDFNIPLSAQERFKKLMEEVKEYHQTPCLNEALDIMNVAISLVADSYGVADPLLWGMLKLEQAASKYRSIKNMLENK